MAEISKLTHAVNRAHVNVTKGFERARGNIADIPLGKEKVDPRTHKKRMDKGLDPGMDTDLSRILLDMKNNEQQQQNEGE